MHIEHFYYYRYVIKHNAGAVTQRYEKIKSFSLSETFCWYIDDTYCQFFGRMTSI